MGLGVFVVLSVLGLIWFFRREAREQPPATAPAHAEPRTSAASSSSRTRPSPGAALREAVEAAAEGGRANVLVVCPALNSPLKHWTSDEDQARADRRGAPAPEHRGARAARDRRPRRGRRRRPAPGDRGRAPHLRRGRDRHLDPSRGPVELARARRRHLGARALRGADHARRRRPRGRGGADRALVPRGEPAPRAARPSGRRRRGRRRRAAPVTASVDADRAARARPGRRGARAAARASRRGCVSTSQLFQRLTRPEVDADADEREHAEDAGPAGGAPKRCRATACTR